MTVILIFGIMVCSLMCLLAQSQICFLKKSIEKEKIGWAEKIRRMEMNLPLQMKENKDNLYTFKHNMEDCVEKLMKKVFPNE